MALFGVWRLLGHDGFGRSIYLLTLVALQNLAAACLSYRIFQQVSGLLQLFGILPDFVALLPDAATCQPLAEFSLQSTAASLLPSFWFLWPVSGAEWHNFQLLTAFFTCPLEFGGGMLLALTSAAITYRRTVHRVIEQAEIAPGVRRGWLSAVSFTLTIRRLLLTDPIDRAILLFLARTLSRSRQHRLILSVYIGMALAISLAYAKSLLYGTSQQARNSACRATSDYQFSDAVLRHRWSRAVFALPVTLPANWIFRISAIRRPASYFSAARKSLYPASRSPSAGVSRLHICPFGLAGPLFSTLSCWRFLGFFIVHALLRKFRKIPFACSISAGEIESPAVTGIAGFAFLFAVDVGANLELWSMQKTARYLTVAGLLMVGALWAKHRTREFADSPYNSIQFEDAAPAEIYALDLRQDAEYINDGDYLDAASSPPKRR